MNNFLKIILLFIIGITVVSCSKSDSNTQPLRDFEVQKVKDMTNIETFMHTHYMTVISNPGATEDQDVTFTLIPTGGTQVSIWDQTTYPIKTRMVKVRQNNVDVDYKIYYLELRQGSGTNSKSPCNVDRVLTAYKGEYIYDSVVTVGTTETHTIISKEFETLMNPQTYFSLTGVIRGWSEIFPQFKTGSYVGNPDGTVSFSDFGAGVMFIPSGLAYYSSSQGGIPAYSPLIFNFKLFEIQRVDHDSDGIYSYQEDLGTSVVNNDGTVTITNGVPDGYVNSLPEGVENPDNTNEPGSAVLLSTNPNKYSEEDEVPDFLDTDDDGDYFTTKSETSFVHPNDVLQTVRYYPYNGATVDNPLTPYVDESKGVPSCSNDFTSPTRIRKYLDTSCH